MSSGSAGICTTLDSGFRRVETISADRSVGVASATDFVVAACGRAGIALERPATPGAQERLETKEEGLSEQAA